MLGACGVVSWEFLGVVVIRTRCVVQRLYVQDDNRGLLFCQQQSEMLSNAIATAGDDGNLFIPLIFACSPIIEHIPTQICVGPSCETDVYEILETADGGLVSECQVLTSASVVREEEQW